MVSARPPQALGVQRQGLVERRRERHDPILAAFALVDADLAAIEVHIVQPDRNQLADARAGVQEGLDEHEVAELPRLPHGLVVAGCGQQPPRAPAGGRAGSGSSPARPAQDAGSDRGVRRLLERYAKAAGLTNPVSPHRLRHFLLTWLKKQGIDDALIQPYSGHASRQSLEIYSRLAIADAQAAYADAMGRLPV